MCNRVNESKYVAEGWACCHCHTRASQYGAAESSRWVYNGLQRDVCKACGAARCATLNPDPHPLPPDDGAPDDALGRIFRMAR